MFIITPVTPPLMPFRYAAYGASSEHGAPHADTFFIFALRLF